MRETISVNFNGNLKIAIYHISKLIANGLVGQKLEGVAKHVVEALKILKEQDLWNLKMVVNLVLEVSLNKKNAMIMVAQVCIIYMYINHGCC